jgi:hypothetical protein
VLFSCCACVVPRVVLVARDSRGSNISLHTCQPQFSPCKPHANLHTGTHVAHHARLVPTLGAPRVGTDVAPLQDSCQLWTWHRCCYARSVPIVGQMLGRGRGLTYVFICSSHSGTKKVKTRKNSPYLNTCKPMI